MFQVSVELLLDIFMLRTETDDPRQGLFFLPEVLIFFNLQKITATEQMGAQDWD